jgi:HlyD family secretion protein
MKKRLIPLIVAALALLIATLYFEVFRHLGEDSSVIEGSGTIEVTEIEIASKIAGRVVSIPKEEGTSVQQGELMVKLEYDELNAQRISARASLINAEKNLTRIRDLYRTGSVSKKDLDNAETAYRVARANFDRISATIGNAVIYAPIDGIVLEKNLEIGEMAFPGTPIVTIANLSKPWIKIYVNERRLGLVKLGQRAEIFVDTYPDRPFRGRVIAISNRAEFTPKTIQTKEERVKLMFAVKIAIENPELILKPGMPADALILLEEGR